MYTQVRIQLKHRSGWSSRIVLSMLTMCILLMINVASAAFSSIIYSTTTTRTGPGTSINSSLNLPEKCRMVPWHRKFQTKRSVPVQKSYENKAKTRLCALIDGVVAKASIQASAKLLTSIGVGGWAARKTISMTENRTILDNEALHALSKLAYWLFQPALLLWAVATTLNESLQTTTTTTTVVCTGIPVSMLLLMLVSAVVQIGIGFVIGILITKFIYPKIDPIAAQDILMCTTFSNAGPLPLIFSDALFASTPNLQKNVAGCISFYLLVWVPMFWTFGRSIIGTSKPQDTTLRTERRTQQQYNIQSMLQSIQKILSPPIVGALGGVIVGVVPILRKLFFSKGAILSPMMGAAQTLGSAYLPAAILILAGSLFSPDGGGKVKIKEEKPIQGSVVNLDGVDEEVASVHNKSPSVFTIVSILFARFVLAPLLSFGLLYAFQRVGWIGLSVATTSTSTGTASALATFTFVLLMEGCMPPTQNSVIMLQVDERPERAADMARLLTTLYSISIIPIVVLLSICLSTSKIMAFSQ